MSWKLYLLICTIFIIKVNVGCNDEINNENELFCKFNKLFEYLNITSFVDENRYIRLNISWDNPIINFTNFEMDIETNCSALYGDQNISGNKSFIIQPRLQNPAEPLQHGCKYFFNFFTDIILPNNTNCILWQTTDYEIPECVDELCECGIRNSPFEYSGYEQLNNSLFYKIKFDKTNDKLNKSLEEVFDKLWYRNIKDNATVTFVQTEQILFDNVRNVLTVSLSDFHAENTYFLHIDLILDNCEYNFFAKIYVPASLISFSIKKSYSTQLFFYIFFISSIIIVSFLIIMKKIKPQLLAKFKKKLPFLRDYPTDSSSSGENNIININKKEIINSQYTPLEFIENLHKYDEFEIARNKIVLKKEIGGGAFGKVYKAEIYGFNKSGYILAAVKKPLESAPEEELSDFLEEIKMMKKIAKQGGHPNIIQIIASVTFDSYMMIMELVPCGSLKTYLTKLRKEWEENWIKIRKNEQLFFPDNMVVENYLPTKTHYESTSERKILKYSDLAFDNYSDTNSYISPNAPSSPESLILLKNNNNSSSISPSSAGETFITTLDSSSSSNSPSTTSFSQITPEIIKPILDAKELQSFALQIAKGMAFLENIGITHRDLAARNILINEDKLLKISDFGMARMGIYLNTNQKRQPLRWMAPEAIENRKCDNKTDVWSFGVVLWEIGSLGAFPYKNLSNDQVITYILQGNRLERPKTCTDQLNELMKKCWNQNPDNRPTFSAITKELDDSSGKIYVDFTTLSKKYVFPPM